MNGFLEAVQWGFLVYALLLAGILTALTVRAFTLVSRHRRTVVPVLDPQVAGVSIVVPAFNEATVIESTIRSLLVNDLPDFEVVVVDDGSTDGTRDVVIDAFDMVRDELPEVVDTYGHQPITGVWRSLTSPVVLVSKINGGNKADAANAGLELACKPLVAVTDADTIVDTEALARLAYRFADREVVAVGANLRLLNGAEVRIGEVPDQVVPSGWIERIQIVEYLRAFAGSRAPWGSWGTLLIVSGGFGMFRRDAVAAAGGYDPRATAEDFDLTLRLQRRIKEDGTGRVDFLPETIAWTEGPGTLKHLASQRARWQRGLAETLWQHRDMTLRRRYGSVGMAGLPFFWLFELAAPFIELMGIVLVVLAVATGVLNWPAALLFLLAAFAFMFALSVASIALDQMVDHRYRSWREVGALVVAALLENFGYRQFLLFVRIKATLTIRRPATWEPIPRQARTVTPGDEPALVG